jgi:chromosome segregation ATPase
MCTHRQRGLQSDGSWYLGAMGARTHINVLDEGLNTANDRIVQLNESLTDTNQRIEKAKSVGAQLNGEVAARDTEISRKEVKIGELERERAAQRMALAQPESDYSTAQEAIGKVKVEKDGLTR